MTDLAWRGDGTRPMHQCCRFRCICNRCSASVDWVRPLVCPKCKNLSECVANDDGRCSSHNAIFRLLICSVGLVARRGGIGTAHAAGIGYRQRRCPRLSEAGSS